MRQHSQKFLQKRKFIMALPILVLPFLTIIFWALGGGQGTPAQAMSNERTGLNLELPDAHFDNEELNKLMLYEQAERDSSKFNEARDNDPYFKLAALDVQASDQEELPTKNLTVKPSGFRKDIGDGKNKFIDPNEAMVNDKLQELYKELNRKPSLATEPKKEINNSSRNSDPQFSTDVDKLEGMMEMMSKGQKEDPEMKQINGMLDKILDVQHPERVREKIKAQSARSKGQVFPVEAHPEEETIGLINSSASLRISEDSASRPTKAFPNRGENSFYGLGEDSREEEVTGNSIEAVVHDTQELVVGATVKMRLLKDVYINGKLIPKDQFVYGTAAINGERFNVEISSIRHENSLFPVSLSVYDLDGIEGIYVPGAITRDVAKQSSDQAMQGMQFMSMDQSLGAQATSAGVQAAKGLFSKKVKLIKVTVKAGYNILLLDKKSN